VRCFIGSLLPGRYRTQIQNLVPKLDGVRFVKPHKYHVTLRFLGVLKPHTERDYINVVDEYQRHFPITVDSVELTGFPSRRRAKVVVLLLKSNGKFEALDRSETNLVPHLTLGYVRKHRVAVPYLSRNLDLRFESVALFESLKGEYRRIYPSN